MAKRSYRVRFFTATEEPSDNFMNVVDQFQKTERYKWVVDNDINIQLMDDAVYFGYGKHYVIYGDLNEGEYTDYALKFYKDDYTDWK